jgi:hypothetical protein
LKEYIAIILIKSAKIIILNCKYWEHPKKFLQQFDLAATVGILNQSRWLAIRGLKASGTSGRSNVALGTIR